MTKNQLMKTSSWKKYIADGLLIIFSVLLALFVGNIAENRKINKQKAQLVNSLTKELSTNKMHIERWLPKQQAFLQTIKEGNLKSIDDTSYNNLTFDAFLRKSAWETTKITGIVSEFDIESLEKLSDAYTMQELIWQETIKEVTKISFDENYQKPENFDKANLKLKISLEVLVMQEKILLVMYNRAIEQLEK